MPARIRWLQSTRAKDRACAYLLIVWNALAILGLVVKMARQWPSDSPAIIIEQCSLASSAAFFALQIYFLCIRKVPIARENGKLPRIIALAGAYLPASIVLLDRQSSVSLQVASAAVITLGNAGAIYVLWHLGRAFSIFPQARILVTSGPYRFIRHPLYLAEMASLIGIALGYKQPWSALIAMICTIIQVLRMKREERVLAEAFPEYERYANRRARLIPGIY